MKIRAIDPYMCGCTECITGEYVPLENAARKHLKRVKSGKARNNTGLTKGQLRRFIDKEDFHYEYTASWWETYRARY